VLPVLSYSQPRSNGLHVTCGICRGMMVAEKGTTIGHEGGDGAWLWYRCVRDAQHITRALPLPVQMARGT